MTMWEKKEEEVKGMDWQGRNITLKNMPVEVHKQKGTVRISFEDLMKAEQEYIAKEHGLSPHNISELNMLYAGFPPFFEGGTIDHKFRFNKMLFYHWKEMEKAGYGDSLIFDKFEAKRAGPIPKHLREDIKEFQDRGIIEVIATKDGKTIATGEEALKKCCKTPGISIGCKLTASGMELAESIWNNTPDELKEITLNIKKDLFFVDSTQLKDKVHTEYPEFQKTYTELDTE